MINPNSCVPPEILKFPLGKQGMAVPGPPLWTEHCPLHFHQGHEASGSHMRKLGIRLILYLDNMLINEKMVDIMFLGCELH